MSYNISSMIRPKPQYRELRKTMNNYQNLALLIKITLIKKQIFKTKFRKMFFFFFCFDQCKILQYKRGNP